MTLPNRDRYGLNADHAERSARRRSMVLSEEECGALLMRATASKLWTDEQPYPIIPTLIFTTHDWERVDGDWSTAIITLPPQGKHPLPILHEIAHQIAGPFDPINGYATEPHGCRWGWLFMHLVVEIAPQFAGPLLSAFNNQDVPMRYREDPSKRSGHATRRWVDGKLVIETYETVTPRTARH